MLNHKICAKNYLKLKLINLLIIKKTYKISSIINEFIVYDLILILLLIKL